MRIRRPGEPRGDLRSDVFDMPVRVIRGDFPKNLVERHACTSWGGAPHSVFGYSLGWVIDGWRAGRYIGSSRLSLFSVADSISACNTRFCVRVTFPILRAEFYHSC